MLGNSVYEWVTRLMGARNMSGKVFIIVWGLKEYRGYLVLMIITYNALDDREVIHCTALSWVGSAEGQEKL